MAKQIINTGEEANDGTGDPIRSAMKKTNLNFTELYDRTLLNFVAGEGTAGQVLSTDGDGTFTFINAGTGGTSYANADVDTHLNQTDPTDGHVLSWSGTDYAWVEQTGGTSFTAANAVAAVVASDLDMAGNKVLFGNVYDGEGDLPSASSYHGMFAHVHSTGAAYYAHSGAWVALANKSDITSVPSRTTATGSTSSLADNASGDLDLTGFKAYSLLTITTDKAAWVRVYANGATRTADNSRIESTDPAPDSGVIAEVITLGAETVIVSPGVIGFNLESTPTTSIPCRVTNKSGSTGAVAVTLSILQLEA
tara:strand:- start:9624 stop:10550 length:927 start_codon:yes stop_codon:yes gene_type:complete